jgi:basic amino acid/polyamine antiporter, APA family
MQIASTSDVGIGRAPLGFWMAVALVMGNMVGSGVFLLPASLAPFGAISLAGWLMSTAGAVLLALVFARLAAANPAAGGPYAFTRSAFGELAGFIVAWGYWISVWCSNAALSVAFVGYLDPFFPSIVRNPASGAALAIVALWMLTGVNLRGVRTAGVVQVTTTVLKILPLVMVGVGGLFVLNYEHFLITDPSPRAIAHGVTATATLTLWAFLGLECATIPAGNIQNPQRTIPLATIAGTLVAAVIYILGTIAVMGAVPPAMLGQTTAPYAEAARTLAGNAGASIISIGAAISCVGALNGWILIVGQLPLAVAEDGLFPSIFRRRSSNGAPAFGLLVGAILSTTLIAMNYTRGLVSLFTFVILLSTLSTLIPYVFCSLAGFVARRPSTRGTPGTRGTRGTPGTPGTPGTRGTPGTPVISALAFVYSLWAISGAGAEVVYWGFLLLLSGLPVYVWVIRK